MNAEVIVIPTQYNVEMLKSTAQQVAQTMVQNGIRVHEQISLCSDRTHLQKAVSTALSRSDILVTIGGMGSETGFLTKQVMSQGLRLPLEHNQKCANDIANYARLSGVPTSPEDITLASLPKGAAPLVPQYGKIPGCVISAANQHIVMLPETGGEAATMLNGQVLPRMLTPKNSAKSAHSISTYGLPEPQVRRMLADLMGTTNPVIAIQSNGEEAKIIVTAQAENTSEATAITNSTLRTIAERLGDYAYGLNVDSLEQAVVQKMRRKELSIAVAESGTNGFLARAIEQKGQDLVSLSLLADSPDTKSRKLGIPAKMLKRKGDVSEYSAVSMAYGALVKGKADLGVGVCADIPGKAQREAAQVYIAVCNSEDVYVKKLVLQENQSSDTEAIVYASVSRGLNMIRLFVDYHPDSYSGSVSLDFALSGKDNVTDNETYDLGQDYTSRDISNNDKKSQKQKSKKEQKKSPKKDSKKKKASNSGKSQSFSKEKEKSGGGKVKKVIMTIAILMLVGSVGYFGLYFYRSSKALELRDNIAGNYAQNSFMGLKQINKDVVAYMSIDGTDVSYPIVQAGDNAYYHRKNFYDEKDQHGVPYMDFNVNVSRPSENMVVYGHNMMDGQVFGELLKYREIEFYREHPVINFDTIGPLDLAQKGEYKIISVFITNTYKKHGSIFNYHKEIDLSASEFERYVKQVELRTLIDTTVDVKQGDKLVTFSTCDYQFSGSRFVVVARKVRAGESSDVDVAGAKMNSTPLMPDVWYKSFGGTRPSDSEITAAGGVDGTIPIAVSSITKAETKSMFANLNVEVSKESSEKEESSEREKALITEKESKESKEQQEKQEIEKNQQEEAAKVSSEAAKEAEEASKKAAEVAKKAEDEKAAELKKLEEARAEEAAKKVETEKQEIIAVEQEKIAKTESEKAERANMSVISSATATEAESYAKTAKTAAISAKAAASNSQTAAKLVGTEKANRAALSASNYSTYARQSADAATANVEMKEDSIASVDSDVGVDSISTATGGGNGGTVSVSGNKDADALDIISRMVQAEVGPGFHVEAIKAQAVASYSFVLEANAKGSTPSVVMSSKVDAKVKKAVEEVLGEAIYYNGKVAFTPYHATSAGATTSSSAVWGGSYPYLVSVDSAVDKDSKYFSVETTMTASKVEDLISSKLGIEVSGDPSTWFEVLSTETGGYNGKMSICGETKSKKTGNTLTGRLIRESVLSLRSSHFSIDYDSGTDKFTFVTRGYGHGVGMSQTGANGYASQGWSYREILVHYYPGTTIMPTEQPKIPHHNRKKQDNMV